ncbi:ATPase [Arthrobacter sp. L77]|uniref:ATPase n=1 Tax=Arthrobacter sp. L77 TaxID=1496689 RepID=UPI0005BC5117|nr:ATPase [Arthrobacter sp. L77]
MRSHVLFISGRSGVGKSTAALALHERLIGEDLHHAVIEGDYLDLAHPAPHLAFPEAELAERNLAAMWSAYRSLGYRRLIYTNTAAVLSLPGLVAAMGDSPLVTAVLLRSSDGHTGSRLARRNHGAVDPATLARSGAMADRLDSESPTSVRRIDTDGLTPTGVAATLSALTGWAEDSPPTSGVPCSLRSSP